jgi:hypothetical protein
MPAGAPAPLIPGETGFYVGDRLVPYGTTVGYGNGGFVGLAGEYRGYNEAQDPIAMLKRGYNMNLAYLDEVSKQIGAPQYSPTGNKLAPGWAERAAAISRVAGSPDFTATGMSGANNVNTNQTNAYTAGVQSGSQAYTADQNLAGHKVSAGATLGAAQARAAIDRAQLEENQYQFTVTPRPVGQTQFTDPLTNLTTAETSYALPPARGQLGGMPRVVNSAKPKASYPDGSRVQLKDGRMATMKNGQPVPDK